MTIGPDPVIIPDTPADITPEWLTSILALGHPDVVVTAAKVSGFFGHKPNKVKATVSYDQAGRSAGLPTSLVIKGGFTGNQADASRTGLDIGLELELLAYAELVPHLPVNTPRPLVTVFDAQGYRGVMVMEELSAPGTRFLNAEDSLSYPQAAAFLDAQARFHAPWLDSRDFDPGGRFGPESGLGERTRRLHDGYIDRLVRPEYWQTFIALPRGACLPRILREPDRVARAQERMNELHRSCAQTIVHGDEHLGNLYIDADGRPGFLDWCARREPWVVGFTYFLLSTLDPLDRRQWERALLRHYLDRLRHHGANPPDFEVAWHAHRCTALFPFLTWLNNSPRWQPESVNTRNTMRAALAVIDHDTLSLLGA